MSRSRRSSIDNGFSDGGQDWDFTDGFAFGNPEEVDFMVLQTSAINFGGLEQVTQLVYWKYGLVSFGQPTSAQIAFIKNYADGRPVFGSSGFPGDFFLVGFSATAYEFGAYAVGNIDFDRPFNVSEIERTTFFGFGHPERGEAQLVLTTNDFTIFQQPNDGKLYGYQIAGRTSQLANDTVFSVAGATVASNDFFRFSGTAFADTIDAPSDISATLLGAGGNDTLRGGSAGDRLAGGIGADTLTGGGGRDAFTFYAVSDSSAAGGLGVGIDLITDYTIGVDYIDARAIGTAISYSNRIVNGVTEISIVTFPGEGGGTLFFRSLNPIDSASIIVDLQLRGNGTLIGLAGDDVIFGGFGIDTLVGGGGSDLLAGGAGADTLTGGTGINAFFYEAATDSSTAANSVDLITDFVTSRDRIAVERLDVFGYAIAVVGTETRLTLTTTTGQLLIRSTNTIAPADIQITTALTITGTNAAETLAGLNRNDTINGLGGIDTIFGNDGNDSIKGGAGNDTLSGGNDNDRIEGEADNDRLNGDAGDDALLGGAGIDSLFGGAGNDQLDGGSESDSLDGGAGADTIVGGIGGDRLTGSTDTYVSDFFSIETGDRAVDTFVFRSVDDSPEFGDTDLISDFEAGIDIIDARNLQVTGYRLDFGSLQLETAAGNLAIFFTGEVRSGDIRIGNALIISGTTRQDLLEGLDGNDSINGGIADDFLRGNLGNDTLRGEAGFDTLYVDAGDDLLDGGRGNDTADAFASTVGVTIDLALGTLRSASGNDTLVSIENAQGGDGDDMLIALDRAPAEFRRFSTISTNATAQQLDGRFGLDTNAAIDNSSSVPHVSVYATSSTGPEIYAVTATTGAQMVVDIDDTVGFDSFIEIRNSVGTRLAFNDQSTIDVGSDTVNDSRFTFAVPTTGLYYIHVLRSAGSTTGTPIGAGRTYTLHVSLPGGALANTGSVLTGGAGNDILISGRGNDDLRGSSDTVSYQNARNGVTANVQAGTATGDGSDSLSGIAHLTGSAFADTLTGDSFNNVLNGGFGNDALISGSGNDTLLGGDGNDGLFFGAFFNSADTANGGAGTLDQVGLQGDYSAGLRLGNSSAIGVEQFVLLPGSDTRFGAPGTESFSYNIITNDSAIAAGQQLIFQANTLRAGESFTLDASGELDGLVFTYAGQGSDRITGSQTGDAFFFGTGRFNAGDVVNGQGGVDQIGLQGSYSGASAIVFGAGQILNIEAVVLLTNTDTRFGTGTGTPFSYDLTTNNGNVAAGQRLAIQANTLASNEVLRFNGSAETDGSFSIFSGNGNDVITGSRNGDTISGRGGADTLTGGGGNDIFLYTNITDSTAAARDMITDFAAGDRIDLSRIDAITGGTDNAFTLIGAAGFGNVAGQLRVNSLGAGVFAVEGDINGDGAADFSIRLTNIDAHTITAADFVL